MNFSPVSTWSKPLPFPNAFCGSDIGQYARPVAFWGAENRRGPTALAGFVKAQLPADQLAALVAAVDPDVQVQLSPVWLSPVIHSALCRGVKKPHTFLQLTEIVERSICLQSSLIAHKTILVLKSQPWPPHLLADGVQCCAVRPSHRALMCMQAKLQMALA
jgi:hypothetical protein